MKNPMVPEERRNCPVCESPVGRSRDGQPGRTEGFCPKCRSPFSFTPKLKAGDLVGGQYEVAGALAHGGLGWIYVARDRNVSDRWVVLKGLLNSGDPDALAAAIAERQFLAQVEHPLIVEIYNFVTHEGAGYIVMEYVGGTSLKQLLKERMKAAGGVYDPLPVDQAIAFLIEILPAFQYLHDLNLIYCDFKPDNIIQVGDAVKLIDLGGVRRLDDLDSAIYGTTGYQAPEVPVVGPSVASDIYTIGRTLTVLAHGVPGLPEHLHRLAATGRPDPAVPGARLALPAAAQGLRSRPGRPVRLRRRAPRAAARRAPRGGGARSRGCGRALDVLAAVRVAHGLRRPARLAGPARAPGRRERHPGALVAHAQHRRPPPAARGPGRRARGQPRGAAGPVARRARGRRPRPGRRRRPGAARRRPLGVARCLDDRAGRPGPWRDRPTRRARSTRSTARSRASSHRSWRWRSPARPAARSTWPSRCTSPAPAPMPPTSPRPPSAWPGSAPAAGTSRALSARSTWCPSTSRAFTPARRRRAGLLAESGGGLPSLSAAMASIDNLTIDPVDRSRFRVDVLASALDIVESTGPDPTVSISGRPASEPDAAGRAGVGLPRPRAAARPPARSGSRWSTSANAVRRWTLR